MGKFTLEKWQCDRCGVILDKRPYRDGGTYYTLRASVDYVTAGGTMMEWVEMCAPCNSDVGKALESLTQEAKKMRVSAKERQS